MREKDISSGSGTQFSSVSASSFLFFFLSLQFSVRINNHIDMYFCPSLVKSSVSRLLFVCLFVCFLISVWLPRKTVERNGGKILKFVFYIIFVLEKMLNAPRLRMSKYFCDARFENFILLSVWLQGKIGKKKRRAENFEFYCLYYFGFREMIKLPNLQGRLL